MKFVRRLSEERSVLSRSSPSIFRSAGSSCVAAGQKPEAGTMNPSAPTMPSANPNSGTPSEELSMPDLKQAALDYQAKGFRVIQCQPKGKVPLVEWKPWQTQAATSSDVDFWWTEWPDANVALVMGQGMFEVDVDGPQGHKELQHYGISVPPGTPTSLTGKGVHYLFRGDVQDRVG